MSIFLGGVVEVAMEVAASAILAWHLPRLKQKKPRVLIVLTQQLLKCK